MTQEEIEVPEELKDNPGSPVFVDYAQQLADGGNNSEAVTVCLQGLSANPSCHLGRLLLARLLFDLNCVSFAVQELQELSRQLPENRSVRRLLEELTLHSDQEHDVDQKEKESAPSEKHSPVEPASGESFSPFADQTLSESEFDLDELEMMDDDDEEEL